MLAATVCGILAGATGCTAIAQWIRNQEPEFWHAIGFQRKPPTTNCYRKLLIKLPAEGLENALRQWAGDLLPPRESGVLRPTAIDGKSLCGTECTSPSQDKCIHLLSLLDQATGGVLGQLKMPSHTNEHKAAMKLLRSTDLSGLLITGDAMFCQRDLCRHITDSGGHYLFIVKDNQPGLRRTIESDFNPGLSPLQRAHSAIAT